MTQAMAARAGNPHVTATLVDEDTLSVNGTIFVRKSTEEVLLQPTTDERAPRLRCSNCHFERGYTFWYKRIDFQDRQIKHCPGCGYRILGVVS